VTPTELFDANQALALCVANKFGRRIDFAVGLEFEDLQQMAMQGLWHASQRFDQSRGLLFSSYAYGCIQGYILRGINQFRYGGSPKAVSNLDHTKVRATEPGELMRVAGTASDDAFAAVVSAESVDFVRDAIDELPERHAAVMRMHMLGMKRPAIGAVLGISRERVRQLMIAAKARVQRRIRLVAPTLAEAG
jgi:RNA polymerase sigma factor (sigma-70 family)